MRGISPLTTLSEAKEANSDRQNQDEIFGYASEIVTGFDSHRDEVDAYLEAYSQGWSIDRMPAVDRAIMRVATWEIVFNEEIPDGVAVNEAVELVLSTASYKKSPAQSQRYRFFTLLEWQQQIL